jgi:hypothetical protein
VRLAILLKEGQLREYPWQNTGEVRRGDKLLLSVSIDDIAFEVPWRRLEGGALHAIVKVSGFLPMAWLELEGIEGDTMRVVDRRSGEQQFTIDVAHVLSANIPDVSVLGVDQKALLTMHAQLDCWVEVHCNCAPEGECVPCA